MLLSFLLAMASRGVHADVTVRVSVACNNAASCAGAYVALVAPDDVMRRPADEAVATNDSAELVVPPGPYVLVAFARGHAMTVEPATITGPNAQLMSVHLRASAVLAGRIVDVEGRPIMDAIVARAGLDAPATISELSPLAMSTLRDYGSTRTDANGAWSIESPGLPKIPLTITAPGYGETLTLISPADPTHPVIKLDKASRLTVEIDRTDEDILLIPRSSAASPFSPDWLDRARARTTTNRTVEWTSLAAGTYDLYAVNTNPIKFQKPEKLTTVRLHAGGVETRVKVSLPRPRLANTSYLKLLLPRVADTAALKVYAESNNVPVQVGFIEKEVIGGRIVYLDTVAAPEDTYLTTTREIFLPRSGSGEGKTLGVQTLQRGTLTFRLAAPAGTKLPTVVHGAFSNCVKDEPLRPMPFAVSGTGEVEMAVPSACRAVVIETGHFAPLATTFSLKPMEKQALGDFRLTRSARAEVHVVRQPSGTAANDVVVHARMKRGATLIATKPTKTDANGFAQISGLPPDEDLVIEAYREGSPLKGSVVVRLDPGRSAVVNPLEIPEGGSLSITARLDDEFLKSFPSASLFALRLIRDRTNEAPSPDTRDARVQSNRSTNNLAELLPGLWRVQLLMRVDGLVQTLDVDPVEIEAGQMEEVERVAKPAIIEGVVLAQQQGIEWLIEVRDYPPSPTAVARAFQSKSDGSFRFVLPREGTYEIDVRRKDPDASRLVLGTKELITGRKLELTLPANVIAVTTMHDGKPAPNARVVLKRRNYAADGGVSQLTMQGRTDEHGQALFESVLEGSWTIEATLNPELPETQGLVTVDPAVGVVGITLHLDEAARLDGRVVTVGGALARGGAVDCVYVAQDGILRSARSVIQPDGTYSMKFAKPVPENLSCGATSSDGAILPFRAKPGTRFDLFMPQETGALRISDFGKMIVADRFWLVSGDQLFDLTWAARAMGSRWTELILPRVPAGRWRLVRAPSPDLLAVVQRRQGIDVVSDLDITPGGSHETTLLPSSQVP
jgi:hypothetical protein